VTSANRLRNTIHLERVSVLLQRRPTIILATLAFCVSMYLSPQCVLGQQQSGGHDLPTAMGASSPVESTLIANTAGIGDLVNVVVFETPDLTGTHRVNDQGDIDFPLVGALHVADLSATAIGDMIRSKLIAGSYMNNPQVDVMISGSGGHGISLLGEVGKPGLYSALGDTRLSTIISMAGGFSQTAGANALVYRAGDSKPVSVSIRDASGQPARTNFDLASGDTVVVERAPIVYVLGDVGKPGGFPMEKGSSSVLRVMAMAAGPTRTSKLHNVYLIHRMPNPTFVQLDLEKIATGRALDIPLAEGDVLYVPTSAMRILTYGALPGLLTSVTSATIYSIR